MSDLATERDRARAMAVALESAVAERDALLHEARALLRHRDECAVNGPRWIWDEARQGANCRACGVAYDVRTPGHRHGCDCGYEALVARIDGMVGGEQ